MKGELVKGKAILRLLLVLIMVVALATLGYWGYERAHRSLNGSKEKADKQVYMKEVFEEFYEYEMDLAEKLERLLKEGPRELSPKEREELERNLREFDKRFTEKFGYTPYEYDKVLSALNKMLIDKMKELQAEGYSVEEVTELVRKELKEEFRLFREGKIKELEKLLYKRGYLPSD